MSESEEELKKCSLCGEEFEDVENLGICSTCNLYKRMAPEYKKVFTGQWLDLPNITVTMLWQGKAISENQPRCDACGKKINGKEIELAVSNHHVSYAAYACQRAGEYRQKLAELYQKIRKHKINATEAFRIQTDLAEEYVRKRPSAEHPVDLTKGFVPLKCPACRKELGSIQVTVKAFPEESPEAPSYKDYVLLPKTPEEQRLINERLHIPEKMTLKQWFDGKDVQPFIEKLEGMKNDVSHMPYMRSVLREMSDLNALVYRTVEKLKEEVRLRPDAVFMLLKSSPRPLK